MKSLKVAEGGLGKRIFRKRKMFLRSRNWGGGCGAGRILAFTKKWEIHMGVFQELRQRSRGLQGWRIKLRGALAEAE